MSPANIFFIVLFVIVFIIGLGIIIRSKAINTWAFDFSTRNVKGPQDAPYSEGFRRASLWIFRAVGLLLMVEAVLTLFYYFSNLHR
jgi:hypothetical protein